MRSRFARPITQIKSDKAVPARESFAHAPRSTTIRYRDMYHIFATERQGQYGAGRGDYETFQLRTFRVLTDAERLIELAIAVRARIAGVKQKF